MRASIMIGASNGSSNTQLARDLAVSRQTVIYWRQTFEREGIEGVFPTAATAVATVPSGGEARRDLMEGRENSGQAVLSIAGLFVGPPDTALALRFGKASTPWPLEAGAAYPKDHIRRQTRSLFSAVDRLLAENLGQDTAQAGLFLEFLERIDSATSDEQEVSLIVDSSGMHSSEEKTWLDAHPRVHVHCAPRGLSWIETAKRWCLTEVSRERSWRGTPAGLTELAAAVGERIEEGGRCPGPFIWTAPAGAFFETA